MKPRIAVYAGTRNIYHDMVVSAKSLLYHRGADEVYFLIEDDTFQEPLPSCIHTMNVSGQTFFRPDGPNYRCMWTYMVMMRTALTKLFPDADRVLSLDHDTIVRKPIDFLWSVDISDHYYAAVEELHIRNREHPYINFGVSVHNLAKLRDGTDDKIISDVNTNYHQYCEQDAVNEICKGQILLLPPEYNDMWFNASGVSDDKVIIKHYAARRQPLNSYPDYQYYERMTWNQILYDRRELIPLPATAKRYDIINHFVFERDCKYFLEIGTAQGETYRNVVAPVRISVDPDPESMATYHMTSDEFFDMTRYVGTPEGEMSFDVIFIDGLHTAEQAYRDVKNALSVLKPGGVIVMHDCLPTSEAMQRHSETYPGGMWTGDVWKAFVKLRSESKHLMYTIDVDFGCGVIDTSMKLTGHYATSFEKHAAENAVKSLPSDMNHMTYEQFVANRNEWMNVKGGIVYDG